MARGGSPASAVTPSSVSAKILTFAPSVTNPRRDEVNICDDLERPPYCIRCELPMLRGLAKGEDGLHKSWTCSCGYVLERTGTIRIELPGGAIFVGNYE